MKVKVSEATETQLDWMVAKIEGISLLDAHNNKWELCWTLLGDNSGNYYTPTTDWAQGGPIFSEAGIGSFFYNKLNPSEPDKWGAHKVVEKKDWRGDPLSMALCLDGHTELIAKARCFLVSRLGDEVEVPEELK